MKSTLYITQPQAIQNNFLSDKYSQGSLKFYPGCSMLYNSYFEASNSA